MLAVTAWIDLSLAHAGTRILACVGVKLLIISDRCGRSFDQLVKLAPIEPYTPTPGTEVDLDSLPVCDHQIYITNGTLHLLSFRQFSFRYTPILKRGLIQAATDARDQEMGLWIGSFGSSRKSRKWEGGANPALISSPDSFLGLGSRQAKKNETFDTNHWVSKVSLIGFFNQRQNRTAITSC